MKWNWKYIYLRIINNKINKLIPFHMNLPIQSLPHLILIDLVVIILIDWFIDLVIGMVCQWNFDIKIGKKRE